MSEREGRPRRPSWLGAMRERAVPQPPADLHAATRLGFHLGYAQLGGPSRRRLPAATFPPILLRPKPPSPWPLSPGSAQTLLFCTAAAATHDVVVVIGGGAHVGSSSNPAWRSARSGPVRPGQPGPTRGQEEEEGGEEYFPRSLANDSDMASDSEVASDSSLSNDSDVANECNMANDTVATTATVAGGEEAGGEGERDVDWTSSETVREKNRRREGDNLKGSE